MISGFFYTLVRLFPSLKLFPSASSSLKTYGVVLLPSHQIPLGYHKFKKLSCIAVLRHTTLILPPPFSGNRFEPSCFRFNPDVDMVIRPASEQALLETRAWYESKAKGLGFEFARVADGQLLQHFEIPMDICASKKNFIECYFVNFLTRSSIYQARMSYWCGFVSPPAP